MFKPIRVTDIRTFLAALDYEFAPVEGDLRPPEDPPDPWFPKLRVRRGHKRSA